MRIRDASIAIASAAIVAGSVIVGQLDLVPRGTICWSVALLNRACAGCGLTRSFAAIGRGDIAAAQAVNPIGPLLFLAVLAFGALAVARLARPRFRIPRTIDAGIAAALAVVLLLRLITFYAA